MGQTLANRTRTQKIKSIQNHFYPIWMWCGYSCICIAYIHRQKIVCVCICACIFFSSFVHFKYKRVKETEASALTIIHSHSHSRKTNSVWTVLCECEYINVSAEACLSFTRVYVLAHMTWAVWCTYYVLTSDGSNAWRLYVVLFSLCTERKRRREQNTYKIFIFVCTVHTNKNTRIKSQLTLHQRLLCSDFVFCCYCCCWKSIVPLFF